MENNKKYIDKVIGSLVRSTKMDYVQKRIQYPFLPPHVRVSPSTSSTFPLPFSLLSLPFPPFSKYCKNIYGLTDQEIEYVWKEYKDIILDKIENGK